jgi:hypothetical protein
MPGITIIVIIMSSTIGWFALLTPPHTSPRARSPLWRQQRNPP